MGKTVDRVLTDLLAFSSNVKTVLDLKLNDPGPNKAIFWRKLLMPLFDLTIIQKR